MIKVGQIYKEIGTSNKWVVTESDREVGLINNYGETAVGQVTNYFYERLKLIAEYPTWQEAVNSKEFKTENEE